MASGRKRRHDLIRVNPAERTVALIGAGFSKGIGIPLQDELLGSLVTEGGQLLSKAIIGRDFDDHLGIEEFFTISDFHEFLERTSSGGSDSRSLIGVIPFKLLEAVHKASDQLRESFLSTVSPLITAVPVWVTLNWDTLLETLFASGGHRFSYFYTHGRTPRSVLKLHGSMDWFKPNARTQQYFQAEGFRPLFGPYRRLRQLTDLNSREPLPEELVSILESAPPAMIAPTHFKQLPDRYLRRIWRDAWSALSWANHLIVVGYSLPDSDVLVRLLLQLSISRRIKYPDRHGSPRVTIVDPDRSGIVETRYRALFPTHNFIRSTVSDIECAVS